MKNRVKNVILFFFISLIYAGFVLYFHIGIPCIFHFITKLKCPGCGITHMYIDVLRLDFLSAYHDNQAIFILQPIIYYFVIKNIYGYIKGTKINYNKWELVTLYSCLIILILFGILRNFM